MEIIFEKISFQPTRYELSKLKTFRNIFKRKKKKTPGQYRFTSLTILFYLVNIDNKYAQLI